MPGGGGRFLSLFPMFFWMLLPRSLDVLVTLFFLLLKGNDLSQTERVWWCHNPLEFKIEKAPFIFRLFFYSEKKYWSHSNVWSWLYTLVPLLPLQCRSISTMTHLDRWYWNGRHAATAVTFAMPASKWSHNIKASLSKTNCSPHIYLRIHIA